MKAALKVPKTYIIAVILTLIGVGIPFLIVGITVWNESANPFAQYPYILGLMAVIYFFVGFIWGDVTAGRWRKNKKDWDGPLPEDLKLKIWKTRWPLYIAAIATFLTFIIIDIYYGAVGYFPFLGSAILSIL